MKPENTFLRHDELVNRFYDDEASYKKPRQFPALEKSPLRLVMVIFEGTLLIGVLRWSTAGPPIALPKRAFAEARAFMERSAPLWSPRAQNPESRLLGPQQQQMVTMTACLLHTQRTTGYIFRVQSQALTQKN